MKTVLAMNDASKTTFEPINYWHFPLHSQLSRDREMGSEENSSFNRPRKMRFQKISFQNRDRKIVFQKKSYFHQNREMDNQKIVYFESRLKDGISRKLFQVPAIFLHLCHLCQARRQRVRWNWNDITRPEVYRKLRPCIHQSNDHFKSVNQHIEKKTRAEVYSSDSSISQLVN